MKSLLGRFIARIRKSSPPISAPAPIVVTMLASRTQPDESPEWQKKIAAINRLCEERKLQQRMLQGGRQITEEPERKPK